MVSLQEEKINCEESSIKEPPSFIEIGHLGCAQSAGVIVTHHHSASKSMCEKGNAWSLKN